MLVLSRKIGESIELPGLGVVVRVLDLKKSRIEIGIDAPRDVAITRGELSDPAEKSVAKKQLAKPRPVAKSIASSLHPWAKIEARIAALAELASPEDQDAAHRIASEAIEQLHAVRCDSSGATARPAPPIRLSEFVTVRTEVLDELRRQKSEAGVPADACVRQSGVGYAVGGRMASTDYSFTA
jgi:carbon storage regulator CsrA